MKQLKHKRFWSKVDIRGSDDCWPWLAYKDRAGYGTMKINGKPQYATHILFNIRTGDWVPKGRQINHTCNNPSCLNPIHLRLGSQLSNMRYMMKCGRGNHVKGEQHYRAKLAKREVQKIKRLLFQGDMTQIEIASMFNVNHRTISVIKTGKRWGHI